MSRAKGVVNEAKEIAGEGHRVVTGGRADARPVRQAQVAAGASRRWSPRNRLAGVARRPSSPFTRPVGLKGPGLKESVPFVRE
ncbi:MAG: hypothetical protein AB2805_07165 [Candidatus Thiodiazotropha sp.]